MTATTQSLSDRPRSRKAATGRTLAAAIFGLVTTTALPAAAQWYGGPVFAPPEASMYNRPPPVFRGDSRPLPPFLVAERLERQGYEDVGRPRYNGSVYEIDATGPSGRRVRLVIDAFRGNIVERYALGRADDGFAGEPRGWFGNNVRPPEAPAVRRYSARPLDEDDSDMFDRLSRGLDPEPLPRGRIETAPVPSIPGAGARPPEQRPRETARTPRPERQAARPDPVAPSVPTAPSPGKIEGVNPDGAKAAPAKPAARTAPRNERAGKPENNRAFETARTEPAPAKPAEIAPPATTPEVPAPIVTPQAKAAPTEKPAATAQAERPSKPVRVIQGVTPVYPEAKEAKPE